MSTQLTVYVRRGCDLCTDMARALEKLQSELGFSYQSIDIDRNPSLRAEYDVRVPVLVAGDVELSQYFLDEGRLRAWCASTELTAG